MDSIRAVLLSLLALSGALAAVSVAAGVTAEQPTALQVAETEAERPGGDGLGGQISSFMQSNAAAANGAIETGMWVAAFESTTNRSARTALVDRRTRNIRDRVETLRETKQRLVEQRRNGEISQLRYEAEMSTLIGEYAALTESLDQTEPRAESVGANTSELAQLRRQANEIPGPEVAAVARNNSHVDAPGLRNASGRPADTPATDEAPGNAFGNDAPGNANENAAGNGNATGNGNPAGNVTESPAVGLPTAGNGSNVTNVTNVTNATERGNGVGLANGTGPAENAAAAAGAPGDGNRGNGQHPSVAAPGNRSAASERANETAPPS